MNKTEWFEVIVCPSCGNPLRPDNEEDLCCQSCGQCIPVQNKIPLFSSPPEGMAPSEKIVRGPDIGTPWRRANWRFLQGQVASLAPQALILDVGAGRGDFADLFVGRNYLTLDVYPYPEVDIVCDLTQVNPFRPQSFDAILLMNVVEHVYDTRALLRPLVEMLKPGGVILVTIPFMVKIHQAPVDFVRYTHFALKRLGEDYGLRVENLEGYYDPIFFLNEGLGNLRYAILPGLHGMHRQVVRTLLAGMQRLASWLQRSLGPGQTLAPNKTPSMAPTGYHIIFRKEEKPRK
jgi:SAM-dependent methyltransferase